MQYQCVIFDWDGTLMDSAAKIVNTMQEAARRSELPVPTPNAVHDVIGISLAPAIQQLFSLDCDTRTTEVVSHYRDVFLHADQTPCPLFPGVVELLSTLSQQIPLAVATGKARRGLERAWDHTATRSFFVTSRCADEAMSKPSPDMLEQILAELQLSPRECLMVGDSRYDLQMAHALGMDRIGVSYGVHSPQVLQEYAPKAIIDAPLDVLQWM